ncbi:hypothetical protein FIBSPDRAFT_900179 [Athelia psychrophila]|uniref:Uncharacterized protein n=1 Tax=Athelia psychrophila TaxID=1759441 RepID=A0A165YRP4_9AGAM|nr:hypothetical protein FIBSPDRAFT_900179 [Fibularhizoctonia sp. CBS 109695]
MVKWLVKLFGRNDFEHSGGVRSTMEYILSCCSASSTHQGFDVLENEDESGRENLMERDPLDLLCSSPTPDSAFGPDVPCSSGCFSLSPTLLNHPPLVPLPFADRVTLGGAFRVNPGWPRWVDTSLFVVVVFEEVEEVSVYNVTVQGLPGDDDFLNSAAGRCIDSDSEDDDSMGYRSDMSLSGSSSVRHFQGPIFISAEGSGKYFQVGLVWGTMPAFRILACFLLVSLRFSMWSGVKQVPGVTAADAAKARGDDAAQRRKLGYGGARAHCRRTSPGPSPARPHNAAQYKLQSASAQQASTTPRMRQCGTLVDAKSQYGT